MLSAELNGHSGGSLEDHNAERNANSGGPAHEVSEWGGTGRLFILHSGKEPGCVLKEPSEAEFKSKRLCCLVEETSRKCNI